MGLLARSLVFWAGFMAAGGAVALAQTVTVDASQFQGPMRPANQSWGYGWGSRGPLDRQLLNGLSLKFTVSYAGGSDWNSQTGPGQPFPYIDADIQTAASVGAHIVLNACGGAAPWMCPGYTGPGSYPPAPPLPWSGAFLTTFQQAVLATISHTKSVDPGWQYLELFLEPTGLSDCLTIYGYVAPVVQQFNATLPAGVPPVLMGGLAITTSVDQVSWYQSLANLCAANSYPLDFASWHFYEGSWGVQLSQLPTIAQGIAAAMASRGFQGPQFLTECGSQYNSYTYDPDGLSSQGASWAQISAFALASGQDVRPCWFNDGQPLAVMNCTSQDPWGNPIPNPSDGTVNPIFNVEQMWSMLKGTALSASSSSLPGNGGVGSIDSTGVAVLVWNADWDQGSGSVALQINNLPSNFQSGSIQYQKYQVDDTTSNILSDSSNFLLQQVASTTLSASSFYSESISFNGSGAVLIILTPSNQAPPSVPVPPPNTLPPTPAPPPPSAGLNPGSYYVLTNVNSGMDLNVSGASSTQGASVIQWPHTPGATNAEWKLGQFPGAAANTYYLQNVNSGLYLGVQNDATSSGAEVVQRSPDGSGSSSWRIGQFPGAAANTYYLVNVNSGLYLGVQADSTAAGALVVLSSPDGSGSCSWTMVDPPGPQSAATTAGGTPPSAASSGGRAACGLTGLETVLVLGLLALRRRRS